MPGELSQNAGKSKKASWTLNLPFFFLAFLIVSLSQMSPSLSFFLDLQT